MKTEALSELLIIRGD